MVGIEVASAAVHVTERLDVRLQARIQLVQMLEKKYIHIAFL